MTPTVLTLPPRQLSAHTVEALKKAYEIVAGVPRDQVDLDGWVSRHTGRSCDTIACAVGWCGLTAWFRERGFDTGTDSIPTFLPPSSDSSLVNWQAVTEFFELLEPEADALFYLNGDEKRPASEPINHKGKVLWRIRTFLHRYGAISEAEWSAMNAAELASDAADTEEDAENEKVRLEEERDE